MNEWMNEWMNEMNKAYLPGTRARRNAYRAMFLRIGKSEIKTKH